MRISDWSSDVCSSDLGLYACNSILGALAARERTGRGQHVEVCLYDSGIAMLINVASNYLLSGKDARRFGNGHPSIVPYTRSEERRVGKECVSPCRSRWSPYL